ncbi:leucine-rich repeat-containing protein 15-like [Musca domestica]|uniref:Leucine rich repeat protein n=1 Tax=Musca domestica TaxID=7370 RepID=T1P9V8_MUSDO|nr:leucine-rich repeat-containing protein 15-like [Musca domestica]
MSLEKVKPFTSTIIIWIGLVVFYRIGSVHSGQVRRIWMQDHCRDGVCGDIVIDRTDYVIMSQTAVEKHIILTFVNSSIAKIPHLMFDTFPNLQVLRMENCSVDTFERPQFEGASNLMNLFLGHNRLKEIPRNTFLGADNLNVLMLNHNQLTTLNNYSFHSLKELKQLSLDSNMLESLPSGVFVPLRKLLDINLARNRLKSLPKGIFDSNLNLTHISLAGNSLKTFKSEIFQYQYRIASLDLSDNVLQELTLNFPLLESVCANNCDMRKLTIMGIVRELELRNNSLRDIPHIPNASNVTALDLSHNPLGSLQGNPFRRFSGLLRLNLSSTGLHDVDEGVFKNQAHLKSLDISSNSLFTLKITMFDHLKDLQYFYFQQNNWNCDFLQLIMTSFVKRRDISFLEDSIAPEFVDDYIDGMACWYENTRSSKKCDGSPLTDAALELAIVRNDIDRMMEAIDRKFIKLFQLMEEMKLRL